MMVATVDGTAFTSLPVLSNDWCVAISFSFNKKVGQVKKSGFD